MAKQQMTADEESILKRQARRRLIGAVALTTAVVVILPMVFDGEPPTTAVNDIELRIPDKDKVGEFQASSVVAAVSASAVVVPPVPVAASAVAPAVIAGTVGIAAAVATQQVQAGKVEHATTEPKVEKVEAAKPAKAEPKPKVEAKPKAEVKPKVETKPVAITHGAPHSGFAVQVGAFSNAATAKSLQEKLAKQGLHVYTEKVGSNVRVRVGSFATREAADKVLHKLESQGLHPKVVNPGA